MIRPHQRAVWQFALLLAMASAGCGSSCGSKDDGNKAKLTAQPQIDAAPALTAKQRAFAALVESVLLCEWTEPRGIAARCRRLKAFWRSELLRDEVLLVDLLDQDSARKRWIGASGLRRGRTYRRDSKLAGRVVTAMEREQNKAVALALADAISRIRLVKTKLSERVKKLIRSHAIGDARARLLKHTLFYNKKLLYDLVATLAREDRDVDVRRAAIAALFTGTPPEHYTDSCTLWRGLMGDKIAKIAALGPAYLTRFGRGLCKDHYDAVLDVVNKRARSGTVKAEQLPDTLRNIYLQAEATAKQKQRALAIALALLENKNNYGPSRARALELLSRTHPRGKALVKAHLKDADGFVMRRAERLSKTR